jgi:transposase
MRAHSTPPVAKRGPNHAIGRSRAGLSTKIHARVDGHGLPVRLALSAGQAADKWGVPLLVQGIAPGSDVIADRGYDYTDVLETITAAGARPHIPTTRQKKVQRSVAPHLYRQRNLIERCFNRLKHFRRLATRFDKLARNYLSTVALAAIRLWARLESRTEVGGGDYCAAAAYGECQVRWRPMRDHRRVSLRPHSRCGLSAGAARRSRDPAAVANRLGPLQAATGQPSLNTPSVRLL